MYWFSSQVDTTSVQALVDTRVEIERWTDHPVEFHFASILSPWIRRSLVACGFGYDRRLESSRPHDLAPVLPPYDVPVRGPVSTSTDIEVGDTKRTTLGDPSYGTVHRDEGPAVQVDTPFFHLDLAEAVAAAESGLSKLSLQQSNTPSVVKDIGYEVQSGQGI